MAASTGIAKKKVRKESPKAQSLRFRSSFISLKNKLFDVITSHLRFTDKDLFKSKRERFHKYRLLFPGKM